MMNKTIGKIFSLLLVLCLLAGCNGSSNTRGGETETVPATTEEETIPPTKEAVKAEETTRAVSGEKETKEETKESTEASTEEETKAEEKQEIIYSTSDRVNVRAYPDLSGAIEGQIEKAEDIAYHYPPVTFHVIEEY